MGDIDPYLRPREVAAEWGVPVLLVRRLCGLPPDDPRHLPHARIDARIAIRRSTADAYRRAWRAARRPQARDDAGD